PQRLEPDVEHRTLPQAALRTSRDQGAEGQLHGPEEPQGVGKGRRYQEEKGRQEEDRGQESQIVQADRQTAEKCQARSAGFAGSQQRRHGAVEAQEARRSITGRCSAAALASVSRGAKALPAGRCFAERARPYEGVWLRAGRCRVDIAFYIHHDFSSAPDAQKARWAGSLQAILTSCCCRLISTSACSPSNPMPIVRLTG